LRVGCITQLEGVQIGSLSTLLKLSLSRITGPLYCVRVKSRVVKSLFTFYQKLISYLYRLQILYYLLKIIDYIVLGQTQTYTVFGWLEEGKKVSGKNHFPSFGNRERKERLCILFPSIMDPKKIVRLFLSLWKYTSYFSFTF
jgi:hypothetical protein